MTDIVSCLPVWGRKRKKRGRKKAFFILSGIFVCLFLLLNMTGIVFLSAEETDGREELNESILEQIGELDIEALQEYVDSLEGFSDESVADRLYDYIKGEAFDYGGFASQMLDVFFGDIKQMLPAFACICAVSLLCGLLSSVKSGFTDPSSADMIFLICYAAALIPVLSVLTECFSKAGECVDSMREQMQIVYPLLLTLMAAGGGSVSAAIYRPAVSFLSTALVSLVSGVVLPLTIAIIAFSMAGNFTSELRLNKFSAFFKSINKWIMGAGISVFGLFLTVQGLTSATYDGIVRQAAKYAIGTGVPIVGGFLSGGFDLAVAGSILIKNSLGSLSIFLLVAVLFEPLVLLIAANLFLRLTAAVTQPFGESRIPDFLGETADNLNYCTAGLLFVGFLYFISIVLIICSSEVLF